MDSAAAEVRQYFARDRRHTAFRVSHGRSIVAIDRTEVTAAVDQGHSEREGLSHANKRIVDSSVAVRVIITHNIADDLGTFTMLARKVEPLLVHRVQNSTLNRFQTISDVRQRPTCDDGQGVVEVAGLSGITQRNARDAVDGGVERQFLLTRTFSLWLLRSFSAILLEISVLISLNYPALGHPEPSLLILDVID